MISYETVTVMAHDTADGWTVYVGWRQSKDDAAPEYRSVRYKYLQADSSTLQVLLEAIAEELYNLSSIAEDAGNLRGLPASPLGADPA